jgi:hypothetical protein
MLAGFSDLRTSDDPRSRIMAQIHLPLALCLALLSGASIIRAEESPDWYPSRFGADDRIGAANHLSAEIVKRAAGLVTTGKV